MDGPRVVLSESSRRMLGKKVIKTETKDIFAKQTEMAREN
jgi:hypothetical protein